MGAHLGALPHRHSSKFCMTEEQNKRQASFSETSLLRRPVQTANPGAYTSPADYPLNPVGHGGYNHANARR